MEKNEMLTDEQNETLSEEQLIKLSEEKPEERFTDTTENSSEERYMTRPEDISRKVHSKAERSRKKADWFRVVLFLMVGIMCVNIAVVAAILPTLKKERRNEFTPSTAKIEMKENDGEPQGTIKEELVFTPEEDGGYRTDKKVQITSLKNDEYIKVCLIPQWYDSEGRLCGGLGEISDFGTAEPPDSEMHTQKHTTMDDGAFVILTYELTPDWNEHWRYDADTGFYYYRKPLRKGETTEPLITGVKISKQVYKMSEGYELRIDVLSESIQTTAGAERIRAFGIT